MVQDAILGNRHTSPYGIAQSRVLVHSASRLSLRYPSLTHLIAAIPQSCGIRFYQNRLCNYGYALQPVMLQTPVVRGGRAFGSSLCVLILQGSQIFLCGAQLLMAQQVFQAH